MRGGYDYIVVGSGSAGAVVAARLSEDPAISVLLLEAGPPNRHPLQLMPLAFSKVAAGRIGTWQYETEPEPGLGGRCLAVPRGRTLGGTSSINAMIAVRGHARDYDDWAALGLPGWSHADVLPYFRKLETDWRGAGPYHGGDGPVHISLMAGPDLLWDELRAAAGSAGIPYNDDPNGAEQDGISPMESTVAAGLRASTARAYLRPAAHRPNLDIVTGALARRILVSGGCATGVEFLKGGNVHTVMADREIVLSGGAYGTPQLLMLSGIGAADELRTLGIAPVHDLPGVGQNLSDHPNIINEYALTGDEGLTHHLRADRAALAALRWFASKTGPFAYTGTAANVFVRSLDGLDRPDVQMMCLPISGQAGVWWPGLQRKPVSKLSVRTGYLHPKSRGWVKLRSADPRDPPRILTNMFADESDLAGMVRALRLSRHIYAQRPLRDLIAREDLPGAAHQGDADLAAYIRQNATHRSHPVGTCRMGADDTAVVDAELRVHGLDALRIADASIMPTIPGGNTNLPVMMIGEKAADLMRGKSPQSG